MIDAKTIKSMLDSQPTTPCDKFACPARQKCSSLEMACSAFRVYAESGKAMSPLYKYQERARAGEEAMHVGHPTPSREQYVAMQQDSNRSCEGRADAIQAAVEGGVASMPELQRVWM